MPSRPCELASCLCTAIHRECPSLCALCLPCAPGCALYPCPTFVYYELPSSVVASMCVDFTITLPSGMIRVASKKSHVSRQKNHLG